MDNKQREEKLKRKHIVRWIVLAVGVLASIVIVIGVYSRISSRNPNSNLGNLSSWISVLIESWTLVMAVVIAVYIYMRQRTDRENTAQKKKEVAILIMKEMVSDGVEWVINGMELQQISECYAIKENFNEYVEIMIEYLPTSQFRTLAQMTETINVAVQHDSTEDSIIDCSFLFWEWLRPLMLSSYRSYCANVGDIYSLLHGNVIDLMKSLQVIPEDKEYVETNVILDEESKKLFEQGNFMTAEAESFAKTVYDIFRDDKFLEEINQAYDYTPSEEDAERIPNVEGSCIKIYNRGEMVFSGKLGFDDISFERDGFVRKEEYEGFVKDYHYEGLGIEYDKKGHKFKEGFWKEGELIAGMEYNWIVRDKTNTLQYNKETNRYEGDENTALEDCLQFDNRDWDPLMIIRSYITYVGLEFFYVADMKTLGMGKPLSYVNIRSLRDFLKEHNPEALRRLEREIEMEKEELEEEGMVTF